MKKILIVRNITIIMVVAGWVSIVEAQPTVPVGQSIYNTTHWLAHPDFGGPNSFYTDFQTTEAAGLAELWAVAGQSNDSGKAYVNWQYHSPPSTAGNLKIGDSNWQYGSIFYHFRTSDMFNGGTVSNSLYYAGSSPHLYIATTAAAPTTANNWDDFSMVAYDQKVYDQYNSEGVYSVNIPVGVKEFWVVISKPSNATSNTSYHRYLSVDPNIIKVAGPNEVPLVLWGNTDPRLLSYEWGRSVVNELGISGVYLSDGGTFIIGEPNSTILDQNDINDISAAVAAGEALGMTTFPIRVLFGLTSGSWTGQTWAAGAEWTDAIRSVTASAQFANSTGADDVIILDMENYGSISNYLIGQTGGAVTTDAYNRGAEFAAAVWSKAPRAALILIPEYGVQGTYPAVAAFRNGLMSFTPHLNVWVGLEWTYGWGPDPAGKNDNKIMDPFGVEQTDPNVYKAAVISYINSANSLLRAEADDPAIWDQYGGIAPGFYMLGTWSDAPGKRSAWYTPELFAAQLEAFQQAGAKLIWEYTWRYPWLELELNETIAAGLNDWTTLDPNNPEYWNGWYATRAVHPYFGAYVEVLKARGTPDPNAWVSQMAGDVDKDFYVDFGDIGFMASQWLDTSPTNGP